MGIEISYSNGICEVYYRGQNICLLEIDYIPQQAAAIVGVISSMIDREINRLEEEGCKQSATALIKYRWKIIMRIAGRLYAERKAV